MFSPSQAANVSLRRSRAALRKNPGVQAKQISIAVSFVILMALSLAMLVLGVSMIAKIESVPLLLDLPQVYLPGNLLPQGVTCYTQDDDYEIGYIPTCFAHFLDHKIYFDLDADTQTLIRTFIPAQRYTIGQLIVAWGKPGGIRWTDYTISLYWGTRSATIYASSLRPDSPVEFILYELEARPGSSWAGFQLHRY